MRKGLGRNNRRSRDGVDGEVQEAGAGAEDGRGVWAVGSSGHQPAAAAREPPVQPKLSPENPTTSRENYHLQPLYSLLALITVRSARPTAPARPAAKVTPPPRPVGAAVPRRRAVGLGVLACPNHLLPTKYIYRYTISIRPRQNRRSAGRRKRYWPGPLAPRIRPLRPLSTRI